MKRWRPFGWGGHIGLAALEAIAWGEMEERRARGALRHVRSCRWCHRRWEWVRHLPGILGVATRLTPSGDPSSVLLRRARGERVLLPVDASRAGIGRSGRGLDGEPDE